MPKGSKGRFLGDTFEQLSEFGQSTAKASVQAVKQSFIPLQILEQKNSPQSGQRGEKGLQQIEQAVNKNGNHTPLDMEKLKKQYLNQDEQKAQALRNRLFQLVKSGEEKVLYEKKKEEEEKKRKEAYEEEEKKRKERENAQAQNAAIPQGKQRKSIFSAKKVAKREQMEVKPSSGKQ